MNSLRASYLVVESEYIIPTGGFSLFLICKLYE